MCQNLNELTACCIAEPDGGGRYVTCARPASGIPLDDKLREMSVLKRFPFVYNSLVGLFFQLLFNLFSFSLFVTTFSSKLHMGQLLFL